MLILIGYRKRPMLVSGTKENVPALKQTQQVRSKVAKPFCRFLFFLNLFLFLILYMLLIIEWWRGTANFWMWSERKYKMPGAVRNCSCNDKYPKIWKSMRIFKHSCAQLFIIVSLLFSNLFLHNYYRLMSNKNNFDTSNIYSLIVVRNMYSFSLLYQKRRISIFSFFHNK